VFALPPTELRKRTASSASETGSSLGSLSLRLPFRLPMCPDNLFGHLAATAVPGVEEWRNESYRRTLRLSQGPGIVSLRPTSDYVACQLALTDLRDLSMAISRCRRLLDLDADPVAVGDQLRADEALAPLIAKAPGRRIPRTVDGAEFAIRAVIGQQVSTAAARTHAARLAAQLGEPVTDPEGGGLTRLFPDAAVIAGADPDEVLAMPRARKRTVVALAGAIAGGDVDLGAGADWQLARSQLAQVPGLGPWTIAVIALRGLGDPDAFPATDLGVRYAAKKLGLPGSPAALIKRAEPWRPWRGYAVQYLWATSDHAINQLPAA
jgi:AraC family transcriptional regulator, regulatory protein of adaptative response / DNA-3-methyladenine glycosylase II